MSKEFFRMKTPCKDCPFRKDVRPYISVERVREIFAAIIERDNHFSCHKTVDYSQEDESGETVPKTGHSSVCAGAAILQDKCGRPSVMVRMGYALRSIPRDHFDMAAPVYDSPEEMLAAYEKENP